MERLQIALVFLHQHSPPHPSLHTPQEFADKLGIPFIETSAVESTNVEEAFMRITKDLISKK